VGQQPVEQAAVAARCIEFAAMRKDSAQPVAGANHQLGQEIALEVNGSAS
jgi:hypothetical protein